MINDATKKQKNVELAESDFVGKFREWDALADQIIAFDQKINALNERVDAQQAYLRSWPYDRDGFKNKVILSLAAGDKPGAVILSEDIHSGNQKAESIIAELVELRDRGIPGLQAEQDRLKKLTEPIVDKTQNPLWRFFEEPMQRLFDVLIQIQRAGSKLNAMSIILREVQ